MIFITPQTAFGILGCGCFTLLNIYIYKNIEFAPNRRVHLYYIYISIIEIYLYNYVTGRLGR